MRIVRMPAHIRFIMDSNMLLLAQSFVDVLAWFLMPFSVIVAVTWVVSLFRR